MSPGENPSRRRLLELAGLSGVSLVAGCGGQPNGGSSARNPDTETPTVVFTDSATPTTTATPTERVFDGGDLRAFVEALTTASGIADATLRVDPGTYQFDPLRPVDAGDKTPHATVSDVQDVTVGAADATFVFTNPTRAGLCFEGGSDITVRGLTIDYDPVPFTQGEVVGLSDGGQTVTLALDDGYPSLSHGMFDRADRVWASVHESDGSLISGIRKDSAFDKFLSEITRVGERRFELMIRNNPRGIAVGRRLTVVARNQGTVLDFYKVDAPTVEDVTVHASGGGVFGAGVCTDPVFRRTRIVPPADSNRQIASDADGIRLVNCRSSATVEGCRHDRLLDDSIVVQHTFAEVSDIVDDRTIAVESVHPFVVAEGDVLGVQSVTGVRRGELPPISGYTPRFRSVGDRHKPAEITFEEQVTDQVAVGDYVGNEATATPNFTVQNNELREHRGILVRVTAGPGLVANNTLVGASRNAIELESDTDRSFSPKGWCQDVTIQGNTIRRSGLAYFAGDHPAAIRCHHLTLEGTPTEGRPHRNIEIVDNDITNCAQAGIEVEAAEDVTIEGNSLRQLNRLAYPDGGYGIALANAAGVTVSSNQVSGSSDSLTAFGRRSEMTNLSATDNEYVVDGESTAVSFRRWVPLTFEFDRAVQPGDGRYLTVRCYKLRLMADGAVTTTYDIGVDEMGVQLQTGYFDPETADSGTWRWFGGESAATTLALPEAELAAADRLEIEAKPIETVLSGALSVDGTPAGDLRFGTERIRWYGIALPAV